MQLGHLASPGQLRTSFVRWAVVTVSAIVVLGFLSAASVATGGDSRWYLALIKPSVTPPPWVFPIAWTLLYVLMGLALALILNARGARGRGVATALFIVQLGLNLAWTPTFFGAHRIDLALIIIIGMVVFTIATTFAFGRIRTLAAWLMVPYLIWISFAGVLTWSIGRLNPNAATLVPPPMTIQISL